MSTNCEPDSSVALLNDVHELIANRLSAAETVASDNIYDDVIVDFDVQFTKREMNYFENESLLEPGKIIWSKILEGSHCDTCHSLSEHFTEIFSRLYDIALQIIPLVASERRLKKIVIEEMRKTIETESVRLTTLGCVEHNAVIASKLLEYTAVYAINIFCKNVNGLLTGKVRELRSDASQIEVLAHSFMLKKRVKKHSDLFTVHF